MMSDDRVRVSFSLGLAPGVSRMFAECESLDQRIAQAAGLGFNGVEGNQPEMPGEVRQLLDAYGLAFAAMSYCRGDPSAGELGLAALPGRESEFRDATEHAVDAAVTLGCVRIHPLAGNIADFASRESCIRTYEANIALACDVALEAGIDVIIEAICPQRQPRFALGSYAQALALIDRLNRPNLRVMLDSFHAQMGGESTIGILRGNAGVVGLLQVGSVPARHEPGTGAPAFEPVFDELERLGWRGWISAEYVPSAGTAQSLAWARRFGVGCC